MVGWRAGVIRLLGLLMWFKRFGRGLYPVRPSFDQRVGIYGGFGVEVGETDVVGGLKTFRTGCIPRPAEGLDARGRFTV